ncbi:MAG: hypothetical protein OXR82_17785 [Gammaproteobacteria bacterium]|nr:hypothetical protein [Gammaproteobacteria bacterium]MDE0260223.1 hypothetical protein [Gammaproteobacteria bacterium]
MYTTCMFCQRSLGANEVVETFPVGRRLAFDAARGRLWVVCRRCERWNLTPLEERWEAVETCDKLFRDTRTRMSSENVGLARHPEGLELVRIGKPLRAEFAAWRYGDQFGRRRRRGILRWTVAGLGLAGGVAVAGVAGGAVGALLAFEGAYWVNLLNYVRPSIRFRPEDGLLRRMSARGLREMRIRPTDDESLFRVLALPQRFDITSAEWFEGEDALRVLRATLPALNALGGEARTVEAAVSEISERGHAHAFLEQIAIRSEGYLRHGTPGSLVRMPGPVRLALEMALHEEDERRALEGELWRLEQAWREAEEIAAIADRLLLPDGVIDKSDLC